MFSQASIRILCFSLMTGLPSKSSLTVVLVGKLAQRRFLIAVQGSALPSMIIPRVIFSISLRVSFGAKLMKWIIGQRVAIRGL